MTESLSPPTTRERPDTSVPWRWTVLLLTGLALLLLGLRLGGPSNLTDNDQERPASYVLDALKNGHWAVQYDWTGDITSKPPLYTWVVAGLSLVWGEASRWTLYLPCTLAMLGSALLVARSARAAFGSRAGLLAGVFLLANPLSAKLVALARTDALFTFCVTLTATLAHAAWARNRAGAGGGWIQAWLAATLATLTKGPLGLVLGFAGLLAAFRERRDGTRAPWSRAHLAGLALWVALAGGWFWLAYRAAGDPLIAKMIRSELVGHAVNRGGAIPGTGLVLVPAYFLSRFVPWSLLAFWGLGLAFRRPETRPEARLLQRFAAAWLVTGIVVLGLASHQRGDLVSPLMPAGALLAAIPAARWVAAWPLPRLMTVAAGVPLLFSLGIHAQHLLHRRAIHTESEGLRRLALDFLRNGGDPERLEHLDAPYTLQFQLGTMRRAIGFEEAAQRLRTNATVAVAVSDIARLESLLGPESAQLRTVASWPPGAEARVQIVTRGSR